MWQVSESAGDGLRERVRRGEARRPAHAAGRVQARPARRRPRQVLQDAADGGGRQGRPHDRPLPARLWRRARRLRQLQVDGAAPRVPHGPAGGGEGAGGGGRRPQCALHDTGRIWRERVFGYGI